jgi:hypothetical protein
VDLAAMALSPLSAGPAVAGVVAALFALAIGWFGFAGVDVPAQIYRLRLFQSAGWTTWDPGWYGGSQVLSYSVVFEPLAAAIGLYGVAALSAAAAAWCVHELLVARWGRTAPALAGTVVFTAGMIVPIAVGQMPFLLGQALGLLALRATRRGRWWGVLLAMAAPLASPVAGAFLLLAAAACLLGGARPRRAYVKLCAGTGLALAAVSLLNVRTGGFPFYLGQLIGILLLCGFGFVLVDRRDRVLRSGFLIYAAAALVVLVIPNPLGGNMGRLGAGFGAAIAVTVAWTAHSWRRWMLGFLTIPLLLWQWGPVMAVSRTRYDPASQPSYYAGLIQHLGAQAETGRLEIPLTARHWETAFVTPHMALARGWERQLDIKDNALFYQHNALTPQSYHSWLVDTGVTMVALPDVALDHSGRAEAALLRSGLDYLTPTWSDAHWSVWAVRGAPGLVTGPAQLRSVGPNGFSLDAATGKVLVRLRFDQGWVVTQGTACATRGPNNWTELTVLRPGTIAVSARVLPGPDPDC